MGATNCPETPRQKMIGMMYLVYTALLALNVSAEILSGFVTVGDAMDKSNQSIEVKLKDSYDRFEAAKANNPEKVGPLWNKAVEVRKLAADLRDSIETAQLEFVCQLQSKVEKEDPITHKKRSIVLNDGKKTYPDSARVALDQFGMGIIEKLDNNDIGTHYFYGLDDAHPDGKAIKLKEDIIRFKKKLKELLGPDGDNLKIALNVEDSIWNEHEGKIVTWEHHNFNGTIAAADMVVLSRLKAEVMNAEFDAVNMLYSQVSANDFKFSKVSVLGRPTSTYVIQGGKYETKINIGAYDPNASFEAEVNGQRFRSDEEGTVTYTTACTTPGEKKIHAKIYVKKDNSVESYEYDDSYFVAEPVAVVSLTKMNVVYAGIDNPVSISVPGVASRDIVATVSEGAATLKADPSGKAGDYIIRATKLGKIKIKVSAKTDGANLRECGVKEIRVKKIPKPVLKIGNIKSGDVVSKDELIANATLRAVMEDFDFQLPALNISSFEFNKSNSGKMNIIGNGKRLTPEMIDMLKKGKRGEKVYIDYVTVKTPDGVTHNLSFTVKLK